MMSFFQYNKKQSVRQGGFVFCIAGKLSFWLTNEESCGKIDKEKQLVRCLVKPLIIGIAGGTGSGKSTFSERLFRLYRDDLTVISYDNYYKAHKQHKTEESEEEVYG